MNDGVMVFGKGILSMWTHVTPQLRLQYVVLLFFIFYAQYMTALLVWILFTVIRFAFIQIQRLFICKPSKTTVTLTAGYKAVTITTPDGATFEGIWRYTESSTPVPGILVYFHGNSGSCYEYTYMAEAIAEHLGSFHIFMPDYRSFGKSNTLLRPSDAQVAIDAKAALEHVLDKKTELKMQNGESPIYLYGHSLGTYAALSVIPKYNDKIDAVILVNPFSTIQIGRFPTCIRNVQVVNLQIFA